MYSYNTCMSGKPIQYTIRNVSERADQRLREQAATYGKSINQAALDALEKGLELAPEQVIHHDLDDLIGSWVEDKEFDRAVKAMRKIDRKLWT